jgi:hypothetical protein
MKDETIDWRRIMAKLSTQIWNLITVRSDHKKPKVADSPDL